VLNGHEELIVDALNNYGYYESDIGLLAPDQSLEELQNYAKQLINFGRVNPLKPFWLDAWDHKSVMTEFNPFFVFGLRFLNIANAYLNSYSRYYACRASLTRIMPPNHPPVMSQLWHRDNEDFRVMKVFLYLSDVDDGSGPLNYVKGSNYGNKWHQEFPLRKKKPFSPRVTDKAIENEIPLGDRITFTGKAGTMILADTMGLHKGGYCIKDERLMFMGAFMTSASFNTDWRGYKLPSNFPVPNSPAVRYAIGL